MLIIKSFIRKIKYLCFYVGKAHHEFINALTEAIDSRDPYTAGHSSRVASLATDLSIKAKLGTAFARLVHIAADLHDIGKIGIRDEILFKKSKLTAEEYEEVKKHPEIGYSILKNIKKFGEIAEIVRQHHERYDGQGYPRGIKGEQIHIGARIIAICDTFDAMTSERAYRPAFTFREALNEIQKQSGRQFDPHLTEIFVDMLNKALFLNRERELYAITAITDYK